MSETANVSAASAARGLTRWSRLAAMVFARLFTIGVVVQVFLVGLGFFEDLDYWDDHRALGESLGIFPMLLIAASLLGRLPPRLIGMSVLLLVLWIVQISLPEVDNGYIAALHPLNAFLLFGLSAQIGDQVRNLTRSPA
jgi:mercuric ion transport protein